MLRLVNYNYGWRVGADGGRMGRPANTNPTTGWRARQKGLVKLVGAELAPALADALARCAREQRRTKKALLSLALEAYLQQGGYWPPPAAGSCRGSGEGWHEYDSSG